MRVGLACAFAFTMLLSAAAFDAAAQMPPAPPTAMRVISVNGEAVAKRAPDQATLPVTLVSEDKNLQTAKDANDKKLKNVLRIARELGIKDEQVKTLYATIDPRYTYDQKTSKQSFDVYVANLSLSITLDEPDKLGPLMSALIKDNIDRIGSVNFGLKDEKKARDDMLTQAVQDAKAKAEKLAAALGVKVGAPLSISENGGGVVPPNPWPVRPMMMKSAMAADGASAESAPPSGLVEIRQNVSVQFAIE